MVTKEIISLNEKLFNEFKIEELEVRYETDPLMLTHLFNMGSNGNNEFLSDCACKKIDNCPELVCGCDGGHESGCACNKIPTCPELLCGCNHDS